MKVRKKVLLNFVKVTAALTLLLSLLLRKKMQEFDGSLEGQKGVPFQGKEMLVTTRDIGDRGSNVLTENHEILFLHNYAQGHEEASPVLS
jgi:hypothetical protein